MFSLALVGYYALGRPSISLLCALLDIHMVLDFHGFASYNPYNSTSVFHWVHDRFFSICRFRNMNNVL